MSKEEIRHESSDQDERREVFAEVSLFGAEMPGSDETGDCGCVSCDGCYTQPCDDTGK